MSLLGLFIKGSRVNIYRSAQVRDSYGDVSGQLVLVKTNVKCAISYAQRMGSEDRGPGDFRDVKQVGYFKLKEDIFEGDVIYVVRGAEKGKWLNVKLGIEPRNDHREVILEPYFGSKPKDGVDLYPSDDLFPADDLYPV